MTIQTNFPAINPSLNLNFAKTKILDSRITFTRASTATYYGTQTAKAEENLVLQSQTFETTWTATNATVTANTTTAPDGTSTAETFDDNVANGVHEVSQTIVTTTGTTYTLSAFLKNVDRQFAILAVSGSPTSYASAKFDLAAGTLGSTQASGAGWSITSSSITSVGNSWYRCTITFVVGTASIGNAARIGMATDGTTFTASQRGLEVYTGSDKTFFVWGAQLEQRSAVTAYTPTTTSPITNYIPVLETAASGVARFDHNPTTFESLGLLLEEQRTNLLLRSEEFQTTWTNVDSTEQTNVIVSPDGTLTGDKIVENTGSVVPYLTQSVSVTSGTAYTFSVYGKEDPTSAKRYLMLLLPSAQFGANIRVSVNLATGASATSGSPTATSVTAVGNGWYRISVTASATATGSAGVQVRLTNDANAGISAYTGDGYSGIYIWGAQLEAGAFPTSYIPTVAATVTRAADVANMTGTNFSSWYNQAEGTLFAEANANNGASLQPCFASIDDSTVSNRIQLRRESSDTLAALRMVSSGGSIAATQAGGSAITANKQAASFIAGGQSAAINGTLFTSITSITPMPTVNRLDIGAGVGSTLLNGTISRIAYYPIRVTNAQLQALTS